MKQELCTAPTQDLAAETLTLIEAFTNERLGLTANVREIPDDQFEVTVIDAFTGDIVVTRTFSTENAAIETAKRLTIGIEVYG